MSPAELAAWRAGVAAARAELVKAIREQARNRITGHPAELCVLPQLQIEQRTLRTVADQIERSRFGSPEGST